MIDSAREAQLEVEQARADVSATVEELRQKLSPNELLDEVRRQVWPQGSSEAMSDMLAKVSRQAQDNPLALGLIGAGIAWLMIGNGTSSRTRSSDYRYGSSDHHRGTGMGERVGDLGSKAGAAISSTASDTLHGAQSALSSAGETVSDAVSYAGEAVADTAYQMASSSSEAIGSGARQASHLVHRIQDVSANWMERYPLAVGAGAIALGAIVGAALPATELEDRQLGEYGDRIRETAADTGGQVLGKVEEVAAKAEDAAREQAERSSSSRAESGQSIPAGQSSPGGSATGYRDGY